MELSTIIENKNRRSIKIYFWKDLLYLKSILIVLCILVFANLSCRAYDVVPLDHENWLSDNSNPMEASANAPAEKQYSTFKIFGPNYEKVEIKSSQLRGSVYYLVSGHGGPDPGTTAQHNGKTLCEDEYAYDITLRLARVLISHGALVYMITRDNNDGIRDGWYLAPDKDERCFPNQKIPAGQMERLQQRVQIINKLFAQNKGKYQRMIEIHVDSRSKGDGTDVFFYYTKGSTQGKKLAEAIRSTMADKYAIHQPGRGYSGTVSERYLYMLKYSHPVATFLELGNIHHERDRKRLIVVQNRQALAEWIAEGAIKDFKSNKK